MRLTGTNVLIEPLPKRQVTPGGVVLPVHAKYEWDQMQWRVLAVGPGRWVRKKGRAPYFYRCEVEPGDHVLTPLVHGNKLAFEDGSKRVIIEHDEIIAKWRPGKTYA